ncbi:mutator type transposase [Tanacetum coccineum]
MVYLHGINDAIKVTLFDVINSEIDSDEDEAEFLVEQRRQLYLTRNDKERVRAECMGVVPMFSNSGPSGASGSNNAGLGDVLSGSQSNVDKPIGLDSKMKRTKRLKEKNSDTTVKINVERNFEHDSDIRKFRRIYVCVGALKSGFKAGQRDLLRLDGCFMPGTFPMQVLTTVGVDPNNETYPLAYAVVKFENKQAWLWFLDCLGDDLKLFKNSNFTFVIDTQKVNNLGTDTCHWGISIKVFYP